ncbi:hypothetical protein [Sphingomonas sp.]
MTEDDQKDREPLQPDAGKAVPSQAPAEGDDDVSPPTEGSPKG